jgi:hypothetical protein
MYELAFSRYDCPGCDTWWYFESIQDIEEFIKDAYPKFPVAEWPIDCKFYPNGLSIYKIVGQAHVMMLRSMVASHDFESFMPESYCVESDEVAKLIYDLQIIVDQLEEGQEYEWPIDQIVPRVDKEELAKTVFHPSRVEKMGGFEWIECV